MSATPPGEIGVYYMTGDYGSLVRRVVAMTIDGTVVVVTCLVTAVLWAFIPGSSEFPTPAYLLCCLFLSYLYMSVLKSSKTRTAGYRVSGLKVVSVRGGKPSWLQMTTRFVFLIFGPVNVIADLIWLAGDDNRQTITDKLAATYVIRSDAAPIGEGVVQRRQYFVLGWSIISSEVSRTKKGSAETG